MFVDINHEKQYIDIWLAKSEATPDALIADMRQQFPKYDIAVWHSGTKNLLDLTRDLLCNNL